MRKLIDVKPLKNYQLELLFSDKSKMMFDVKPYLDKGKFKELQDIILFRQARISFDAIEWPNGVDIDPDIILEKCLEICNSDIVMEHSGKYREK